MIGLTLEANALYEHPAVGVNDFVAGAGKGWAICRRSIKEQVVPIDYMQDDAYVHGDIDAGGNDITIQLGISLVVDPQRVVYITSEWKFPQSSPTGKAMFTSSDLWAWAA